MLLAVGPDIVATAMPQESPPERPQLPLEVAPLHEIKCTLNSVRRQARENVLAQAARRDFPSSFAQTLLRGASEVEVSA